MADQSRKQAVLDAMAPLSREEVLKAYRGWAPVYDWTFGLLTRSARRQTVARINRRGGRVLDVGVGTGLSLPIYALGVEAVGVDLSPDMLGFAQAKMRRDMPANVLGLVNNDAGQLAFADGSFETVVAMMVLSATYDPAAVIGELVRVLKPGGEMILVNYFSHNSGWLGWVEKAMAPHAKQLGWRPDLPILPFVERSELILTTSRRLAPWGMYTLLSFQKEQAVKKGRDQAPATSSEEPEHSSGGDALAAAVGSPQDQS